MAHTRLAICAVALLACYLGTFTQGLTFFYLLRQDVWLLLAAAAIALLAGWKIRGRDPIVLPHRWTTLAVAFALVVVCYAGHHWLLSGHALTRDEQMVLFDAQVFASGRLAAPLPAEWVQYADALNTMFMLPVERPSAWASSYLPMNAALHAVFGMVGDAALTGPLLVGLGAIALHGCVRHLWPDNRELPLLAMVLYVGSSQTIFTGMTSYAMSAHLALNLVWLWLYLQRRPMTDLAALAIGFVATGLHQPIFHPLFVGPLLALLLIERNWRRAALFAVGYGAICVFWLLWPKWMLTFIVGPQSVVAATGVDYLTRLIDTLRSWDGRQVITMILNLLRFLSWQHILLLPLALASIPAIRRGGLPAALACGVLLPILVMLVILPYQGHGFGYRYIHGVTGSCILLAIYGWLELARIHSALRSLIVRTTVAGLLILLPLQAWMAHGVYAPYARASQAIDRVAADFAIVGANDAPFSIDLVINHPRLSNRPVRLIAEYVNEGLIGQLCRARPGVVLLDDHALAGIAAIFGDQESNQAAKRNVAMALEPALRSAGCQVSVLR